MRLTLRTLIAYLDDVLEPSQISEIGKKLDESGYAASLVERIKDVLRRRRLTAPEVEGPGSNPDPNTVAEYLDNTLSPESVADVEKICLNSDVNLVEVAASHQILTLVLGEPATISPETRERIYALGPTAETNEFAPADSTQSSPASDLEQQALSTPSQTVPPNNQQTIPANTPEPFSSRIPDYLKTKPLWKRFTPYLLILVAGVVWAWLFLGDRTFFPILSDSNSQTQLADNSSTDTKTGILPENNTLPTKNETLENQPQKASTQEVAAKTKAPAVDTSTTNNLAKNKTSTTNEKPPAFDAPPPADSESVSVANAVPAKPPVSQIPDTKSKTPQKTAVPVTPAKGSTSGTPNNKTVALNNSTKNKKAPTPPVIELADAVPQAPAAQIESEDGFFLSHIDDKRDLADKNDWVIHSKVSPIQVGSPIASPEPFTARINIPKAHCKVVLLPGTTVTYEGKNKAAEMGFRIQEGRIRIEASRGLSDKKDAAGPTLSIQINDELWRVELVTRDTVCGIEINPVQPTKPGESLGAGNYTGMLYTYSGMVRFSDGKGKVQTIDAGQWMSLSSKDRANNVLNPSDRPKPLAIPRWVSPNFKDSSYLSRRLSAAFVKELNDDQLISLTMSPITKDSKPNISELATKALAITNRYQELVKVLDEVEHHESRIAAINGIRNWLTRDPQNEELLKEAIQTQFSPEIGEILERLLWGFEKEDAQDRFISGRLVEWLEHNHVIVRELAFNHIYDLTGRTIDYSAIATPAQRRTTARRWFAHVEKYGALVPPEEENTASETDPKKVPQ